VFERPIRKEAKIKFFIKEGFRGKCLSDLFKKERRELSTEEIREAERRR